ncbi:putative bifunctional diguanylate cyclase/phosphodiesterase [Shewanella intestini]|uniref:Bifunctional diguanylate cyclase/phosphodiesterase n=1 Tax=Shewanella intestini TaxID=2017544 RepID=A0ABS5HY14_9GAMM|nr:MULTISPECIES: bifunctional diguanylate cyclase/phosphodiesterase [Shewanella]MBR9726501.1 bifunctional diguanylate cyclase/phosphodiesterase [Shewanella intestini]MRG34933.1 EAL domain-containing protein [Shewanella sp. XMDDZSB0408]
MLTSFFAFFVQYSTIILLCLLVFLLAVCVGYIYKQTRLLRYLCANFDTPHQSLILPPIPRLLQPLVALIKQYHLSEQATLERDKLTGLINRVGIKRALSERLPLNVGTLMLIDIRKFRFINDLWGFNVGDNILMLLANRLTQLNLKPNLIARMNGNEFLLYFHSKINDNNIQDIMTTVEYPYRLYEQTIELTMRAGVLDLSAHQTDMSMTLRRLDLALQKAKRLHHGFSHYEEGEDCQHHRQLTLSNGLAKAVANNDFFMVYQPKFNCQKGAIDQLEALLRWQHPQLGIIYPNEFIHLAERCGMMKPLSLWVIERVIAQVATWQAKGIDIKVAINLSASDLENPQLISVIRATLEHYQVNPNKLVIEVTESAMMASLSKSIRVLNLLRELGVSLAIDDFGTGQSSLAYLRHLPVDEVKVDRAFISDFDQDDIAKQIVKTTIKLTHQLGLSVTVEGIETQKVADYLQGHQVDYLQGLYIAKPLLPDEVESQHVLSLSTPTHCDIKYPFASAKQVS